MSPHYSIGEERLSSARRERKALKSEIKSWISDFEAQHSGRKPTNKEKEEIRHLFERRNELEAEMRIIEEEMNAGGPSVSAADRGADEGEGSRGKNKIEKRKRVQSKHRPPSSPPPSVSGNPGPASPVGDSSNTPKKLRTQMSQRFRLLQKSLSDDNYTTEGVSGKAATFSIAGSSGGGKWNTIRSFVRRGDGASTSDMSSLHGAVVAAREIEDALKLPAGLTRSDLAKEVVVGGQAVQDAENFLRSPSWRGDEIGGDGDEDWRGDLELIARGIKEEKDRLLSDLAERRREFEEVLTKQKEIIVASVPLETLRKREEEAESSRRAEAQRQIELWKGRVLDVARREESARLRLKDTEKESILYLNELKAEAERENEKREQDMSRRFTRARIRLERTLERQKAILKERFGTLVGTQTSAARRYQLMWSKVPQPLEIRIHLMKDVCGKLRRGRFAILATMYSRLGGHMISWSKFPPNIGIQNWGGTSFHSKSAATKPVKYSGKYFHRELRFDQSVYALCPSAHDVRPSNIILFELYELMSDDSSSSASKGRDKVIGWAALPMVDAHFRVISGRFRLPFVRGPFDRNVKKYADIEGRYARDLSLWLANLYIDIKPLPREAGLEEEGNGKKIGEFDIEYDHIKNELTLKEEGGEVKKKEKEEEKKTEIVKGGEGSEGTERDRGTLALVNGTSKQHDDDDDDDDGGDEIITPVIVNKGINTNANWWQKAGTIFKKRNTAGDKYKVEMTKGGGVKRKKNQRKRRANKSKPGAGSTIVVTDDSELEGGDFLGEDSDGEDGGRVLSAATRSILPGSEIAADRNRKKQDLSNWSDQGIGITRPSEKKDRVWERQWYKLTDTHEMELFTIAVANDPQLSDKPAPDRIMRRKLVYLYEEIVEDLSGYAIGTVEFWLSLLILVSSLWMRMYFHFMGQWMLLKLCRVPLFGFKTGSLEIIIKYTSENITTWLEVLLVSIGQIANIVLLAFFSFCCFLVSRGVGKTPEVLSKFVLCFGVGTILDPILIFAVDIFHLNYDCSLRSIECAFDYTSDACRCVTGDAFKLWFRMARVEASGVTGAFYTMVIYVFTTICAMIVFYLYVLHAHMDGRMLDLHKRIHGGVDQFFVPDDSEISLEELEYILNRAKNWKGAGGSRKKVQVNTFEVTDEVYRDYKRECVHIAIFTTMVDGTRDLWRHFLRQENGSIVEINEDSMQHFSGRLALEKLLGCTVNEDGSVNMATDAVAADAVADATGGKG